MAWHTDLTRVTVARQPTPTPVTFIYPYYENARFFADQVAGWWTYPEDLRPFVTAVIVDDGSPDPARLPAVVPFPIRLFRISVDVRWNWLAARNIGAHHAAGWLLLTDMDHVVPPATVQALVWGTHDPRTVYLLSRREHTGQVIAPHSASYFLTREMFWTVGGYDETLSGFYGTDGEFRRRAAATAPLQILTDALIRYEYVADASTTRYARKQPEDTAVRALVAARRPGWHPKVLSFPYQEVTCSP